MSTAVGEDRWAAYEQAMYEVGLDHYRRRLGPLLAGAPAPRVLDLGAGPGQWAVAAVHEGARVLACDQRIGEALHGARAEFPRALSVVRADAAHLPFPPGRFDLVLCMLVLPYVDVERTLDEVARVLSVGGQFHGVCHGPGYYLLQARREALPPRRNLPRRLLVLGYTVLHRLLRFRRYHYETYQTPGAFRRLLLGRGFEVLSLSLGGHPTMPERSYMGTAVFFEFLARRNDS